MKHLVSRYLVTLESIYYRFLNLIRSPKDPSLEEMLARYLKKKKKEFDPKTNKVVAKAFLPIPDADILARSVYNISRMSEKAIWDMGRLWTVINPWPKRSGMCRCHVARLGCEDGISPRDLRDRDLGPECPAMIERVLREWRPSSQ